MYAIVENNEVKQIITNPKSLVIGDVRYPAKIFELWSKSELNAIGIYEDAVDEDGNNILDDDGNQVINYGLKTEKKRIVKQQASGLLAPTDWYVVKATEVTEYNVPENITTFRSDVRAKSNEMETQIDACTTVDELKALYEYTEQEDGTQTRPLVEFPKEVV
jgi:hypothetical protein